MDKERKILIIGAKGMLGQELFEIFKDKYRIFAWDIEDINIADEQDVDVKISVLSPNVIINAAAYNNVDGSEDNIELANLVNGYGPGFLAKAAKKCGATILHYSSDYIFDGKNINGYKENDFPNPISVYGKSKLLGETEVLENTDKYYIIRLSKLFGKEGSGDSVKKSFVDKILEMAKDRNSLEVINEEVSSPTYVFDLARKTKYILENNLPYTVYHGSNSGACTWYEWACEILKNRDIKVIPVSGDKFYRSAKRPQYSILLNNKLPQARSWQEALKEYLIT